jgi:opacity protein-like surface antigen
MPQALNDQISLGGMSRCQKGMTMKKIALAALLAASALGSANAATVINFDDLTGGGIVADGYAGVKWDSNFSYYDSPQDPYNPSSPRTRIYSNYDKHAVEAFGSLALYVGAGSVFSGAYLAGRDYNVTIESYLGGVLKATSSTILPTSTPTFLSSGYAGSVDEIRFTGNHGFYIVDDVTFDKLVPFGGAGVPEPQSWALMIAGFGLVGAAMRRRKAALAA